MKKINFHEYKKKIKYAYFKKQKIGRFSFSFLFLRKEKINIKW